MEMLIDFAIFMIGGFCGDLLTCVIIAGRDSDNGNSEGG